MDFVDKIPNLALSLVVFLVGLIIYKLKMGSGLFPTDWGVAGSFLMIIGIAMFFSYLVPAGLMYLFGIMAGGFLLIGFIINFALKDK